MDPQYHNEYIYAEQILFFVVIFIIVVVHELIKKARKMGDISDYYRDQELDRHFEFSAFHEHIREKLESKIWTTKYGKKIPFSSMTKSHIENSIKCIENGSISFESDSLDEGFIGELNKELERRNKDE